MFQNLLLVAESFWQIKCESCYHLAKATLSSTAIIFQDAMLLVMCDEATMISN